MEEFIILLYTFFKWVLQMLSILERPVTIKPPKQKTLTLQERTQEYIVNKKNIFLRTFYDADPSSYSSAIAREFYTPKELQMVLSDESNPLEPLWRSRILIETTPRGNIAMYYDAYKQGFSYYSDIQGLSYSFMNAVAMKYVIMFRCRDFFVDALVTPEGNESPLIEKPVEASKKEEEAKNVFIKHKKREPTNKPKERDYSMNRFIRLGNFSNFNVLQIPEKKSALNGFSSQYTEDLSQETTLQKQVMNYSDFKRKQHQFSE
jgi:hypothetical protein